ncbi:envelope protein syncytin-mar1 [Limosa lapponica baueri]|uniref:Envelope protein syncytin-mar1 n=1 Tax=Limosa lapponica baueri TaxID=1758121 RepID=A0A2I0TC06_LIMLA|nr:envelope protein syncytin-mar1 [Limosa lapponica baueri]
MPPPNGLFVASTKRYSLTDKGPRWAWVNESGHMKLFSGFWSPVNLTLHTNYWYKREAKIICDWRNDTGAWYCHVMYRPGRSSPWQNFPLLTPLGMSNSTYFQVPYTPTGLFENGTRALKGHYWICGHHAYKMLPANWTGTCYVGVIHPLFFLLPENGGKDLSVKLYDDLTRNKRSIDTSLTPGSAQKWGKDDWPPQRIIKHYGPATWIPNELTSCVREPIYNLNRIIRLQAVLEIITNETAHALDLLADQATQMRTAILQHRMVLAYLLAEEEGVCGKLNNSNCCLKIDNNSQVVQQITSGIRKLAHVPVQTWKDWEIDPFSWLPGGPWVKRLLFYLLCGIPMLLFLPCIIPCLIQLIQRVVQNMQFVSTVSPNGVKYVQAVREPVSVPVDIV